MMEPPILSLPSFQGSIYVAKYMGVIPNDLIVNCLSVAKKYQSLGFDTNENIQIRKEIGALFTDLALELNAYLARFSVILDDSQNFKLALHCATYNNFTFLPNNIQKYLNNKFDVKVEQSRESEESLCREFLREDLSLTIKAAKAFRDNNLGMNDVVNDISIYGEWMRTNILPFLRRAEWMANLGIIHHYIFRDLLIFPTSNFKGHADYPDLFKDHDINKIDLENGLNINPLPEYLAGILQSSIRVDSGAEKSVFTQCIQICLEYKFNSQCTPEEQVRVKFWWKLLDVLFPKTQGFDFDGLELKTLTIQGYPYQQYLDNMGAAYIKFDTQVIKMCLLAVEASGFRRPRISVDPFIVHYDHKDFRKMLVSKIEKPVMADVLKLESWGLLLSATQAQFCCMKFAVVHKRIFFDFFICEDWLVDFWEDHLSVEAILESSTKLDVADAIDDDDEEGSSDSEGITFDEFCKREAILKREIVDQNVKYLYDVQGLKIEKIKSPLSKLIAGCERIKEVREVYNSILKKSGYNPNGKVTIPSTFNQTKQSNVSSRKSAIAETPEKNRIGGGEYNGFDSRFIFHHSLLFKVIDSLGLKNLVVTFSSAKTLVIKADAAEQNKVAIIIKELLTSDEEKFLSLRNQYIPELLFYERISKSECIFVLPWLNQISEFKNERDLVHDSLAILKMLEDNKVIHRDIRPANLGISDEGKIYLIDYDLAISNENEVIGSAGVAAYHPPETIQYQKQCHKSDVYSMGLTIKHIAGRLSDHRLETIVESMLENDYDKRPTGNALYQALCGKVQ
ncbi:hypothetical protein ROZALSC1DRAFT_29047 [Rozella allomycis CSF55]|uniref:Protein kinase domain-containing protein n=1 Tax=Rozella allomycis (strain CSF55) TaxID=988480 RepID=A0A4P9YIE7_ROZAC|nr:hypothetical protein ROZALSC1DRAFT_29047 [Rozella allomycis CSF55]